MPGDGHPDPGKHPGRFRVFGKNRYELGKSAVLQSPKRARFLMKALSRLAAEHPELAKAGGGVSSSRDIERENPGLAREIEGMASALGTEPSEVFAARRVLERVASPACTNFGAVPPATREDHVVVSWNFDAPHAFRWLMGRFPFFVREIEGTRPYLCFGFPGLYGIGILNCDGLSCVVNAVGLTDSGEGLSPFELNNIAMENCSTVDEAAEVFRAGPRQVTRCMESGMLMNWNMIWADSAGALSVFEYSHNNFHQEKASDDGVIASTNHHQFLDRGLSGSFDPDSQELIAGSYSRLARTWRLLGEHQGRIDQLVARRITSDHIPDYSLLRDFGIDRQWWEPMVDDATVCAHPWNFKRHLLRGEIWLALVELSVSTTLYSIQVYPKRYTVWLAPGHPCRKLSTPYFWGKALGVDVEGLPGAIGAEARNPARETTPRGMFRKAAGPVESLLADLWCRVLELMERKNFS